MYGCFVVVGVDVRFGLHIFDPWFKFMEPINIRMYYGGQFVTKRNKTTYERHPKVAPKDFGVLLRLNVEEVCFFEFQYWVKTDLGYNEDREIWFRKHGCSLHTGRAQVKSDKDIPELLKAPEKDGFYHLFLVHPDKEDDVNRLAYGPGVQFYADSEQTESFEVDVESGEGVSGRGETEKSDSRGCEGNFHVGDVVILNSQDGPQETTVEERCFSNPRSERTRNKPTLEITNPTSKNTEPSTSKTPQKNTHPKPHSQPQTQSQPNPQPTPQARHKLPVRPSKKKPISAESSVEFSQNTEEEGQGSDEVGSGESEDSSDDADSDVLLSDDDFEDKDDDDLFHEFVDNSIEDTLNSSFSGLALQIRDLEDEEQDVNGRGLHCPDDVDLNDSDDEPVSVVDSDEEGPQYPTFNPATDFKGKIVLTKGLKFGSNCEFRKAVQWQAIQRGYNYCFLHNNNSRVSVYCANRCKCQQQQKRGRLLGCSCGTRRKCRFKIHCKRLKGEQTWQIRSIRPNHICGHQTINPKCTSQYLAERYLEDLRDDPTWKLSSFQKRAKRECRCEVGYYKVYYAKKIALKMIFGDADLEYEKVWDYAATIRKYNPGSSAIVKVTGLDEGKPEFQRMYICLKACKEGFMAGCRPILGVDGAHLKGPYTGILMTAVGKDGNNNLFPVAWAVVETENSETWCWFLSLLRNDIASVADSVTWLHEQDELTYMSDRQKVRPMHLP